MAITRSFDKPFEVVDYTEELMLVPNKWGLINQLGLFMEESVAQHTVTFEESAGSIALVTDRVRGERNNVNKDDTRKIRSFPVPHFPLDDAIFPEDIQGKRAYGDPNAAEMEDMVMARKLERIRNNHAITLEAARAQAIVSGTAYAPNGTIAIDYFTEFGITREEIDFDLGTATTDVAGKVEQAIAHIQDQALTGGVVEGVVCLCSPGFFSKLIAHAKVTEAYKYYSSTQEPLRNRLGGAGLYRRFMWAGVEFIEYRGSYNGTALIPTDDAYFVPTGVEDMFVTYFSPANKFSHVNTLGEQAYAFQYRNETDDKILIQTESNFLNVVRRPAISVRAYA